MVQIGVIGDYTPVFESHPAVASAIELAARSAGIKVSVEWLPTPEVSDKMLEHYDALWASPGSPYSSMDGMLSGIRYAREHGCPMVATWGGFQYALVERARNVLGIANADTAENGDPNAIYVVTPVSCEIGPRGGPKLHGQKAVRVLPGTRLAEIMGAGEHDEGFFCNYEANLEFMERFVRSGLRVNALGPDGEVRGVEIANHPFFVATLFQPPLTSKHSGKPHPVILAYLEATQRHRATACNDVGV